MNYESSTQIEKGKRHAKQSKTNTEITETLTWWHCKKEQQQRKYERITLQPDSHPQKNFVLFTTMRDLWKWWKMLFISSQKLSLFSRYLKFLSWLFDHVEKNDLIRKKRLISKFMASQSGQQIHILPIISKSKGNQTMKFGQLIEYYKRNIFLKIMHKMR